MEGKTLEEKNFWRGKLWRRNIPGRNILEGFPLVIHDDRCIRAIKTFGGKNFGGEKLLEGKTLDEKNFGGKYFGG